MTSQAATKVRLCTPEDDRAVCDLFKRVWLSTGSTLLSSLRSLGGMAAIAAVAMLIDLALVRHAELRGPAAYAPTILFFLRLAVSLAAVLPVTAALAFRSAQCQRRYIKTSLRAIQHVHAYCARPSGRGHKRSKACWVFPGR